MNSDIIEGRGSRRGATLRVVVAAVIAAGLGGSLALSAATAGPTRATAAGGSVRALSSASSRTSATRIVQRRLERLGYLGKSGVDGLRGPATGNALVAFQKWQGLPRTGIPDERTLSVLATAQRPAPVVDGAAGRRLEVLVDRQVLLAIDNNQVVRTIDVSTGKPSTPTPIGSFKVYAKYPRWWSTPFQDWLLWAAPFSGGIAVHEYPSVPTYAASHGCVRVTSSDARWVFQFVSVDTPVRVLSRSASSAQPSE